MVMDSTTVVTMIMITVQVDLKYLRGLKWSHLTEKVAYERRVGEQKLREEMIEARHGNG